VLLILDDDAYFNHYWVPLEFFLQKYSHDIILAKHAHGVLNCGAIIIRNNLWAKKFFLSVLTTDCDFKKKSCCWEQDCIRKLLKKENAFGHVGQIDSEHFNCCDHHQNYNGICDPFIWHSMGNPQKKYLIEKRAQETLEKMVKTWSTSQQSQDLAA